MEEKISRKRFMRLGGALGVGAATASVLAACGGGSSGSSGGGANAGGSDGGESDGGGSNTGGGSNGGGGQKARAGGGQAIARASEVRPGSAVEFEDSGNPAVLVRLDGGDFVAYSAVCTHQGCEVAYQDGQLACPCHGSIFDPANGAAVVSGPAQRPLPEVPVEVRGGEVLRA